MARAGRPTAVGGPRQRPRAGVAFGLLALACAQLKLRPGVAWAAPGSGRRTLASATSESWGTSRCRRQRSLQALPREAERLPADQLKVGMTLDGRVKRKTDAGVSIDIGYCKFALVFAPKKLALEKLQVSQKLTGLVVESISEKGIYVSVPDLPKLRLLTSFKEGETVDGSVGKRMRLPGGEKFMLFADIGAERMAFIKGSAAELESLSAGEELKNLVVAKVDPEKNEMEVSLPILPAFRIPVEELKVGMTVNGKVSKRTKDGVFVNIGYMEDALVYAPRALAMKTLQANQWLNGCVVESVDAKGVRVTVPGLPKPRLVGSFEKGETVDGSVAMRMRSRGRVMLFADIGAERMAFVKGSGRKLDRLANNEELKGLVVEKVDLEKNQIEVSAPGLSDVLAARQTKTFASPESLKETRRKEKEKEKQARKESEKKAKQLRLAKNKASMKEQKERLSWEQRRANNKKETQVVPLSGARGITVKGASVSKDGKTLVVVNVPG